MTRRILRSILPAAVVASTVAAAAAGQTGPWTPSRLPDGQLDIRGHWISDAVGGAHSVEDGRDPDADVIQGRAGERNPILIVEPADGRIPYQPAAAARRQQLLRDIFTPTKREQIDPHIRALLDGVPRNNYVPGEMQILQVAGAVVILYESNHSYRVIPLDGRHPPAQVKLWMGDSRGDYSVTLEDPKVFTRPWKMAFGVNRNREKNYEIWEDSRHEGEQDVEGILAAGRTEKAAGITGIHEHRRDGR
jgi:hypothetical protein